MSNLAKGPPLMARLLVNHAFMGGLFVLALTLPSLLSGGFDWNDPRPLMTGAALGMTVQAFWVVTSFLLLSNWTKWTEKVFAATVAAAMLGLAIVLCIGTGAIPIQRELLPRPFVSSLSVFLPAGVCLYFITLSLTAARISNNAGQTLGYFLLMVYWPFTLSFFARRLRLAFELAAEKRARVPLGG